MTQKIIMFKGDWDKRAQSFINKQGEYSDWSGEKYFGSSVDERVFFLFILNKTDHKYKPNEKWVKVSVIANWELMRDTYMTGSQKKKLRDIGIYRAMDWIFEEMDYDGMYGMVRDNDRKVFYFMQRMNGGFSVPLHKTTSKGIPLRYWEFTRDEYRKSSIREKAEQAMLDF